MNEITITVDERLIVAICDAALKNQGINMLQACSAILAKITEAKKGNGYGHGENSSRTTGRHTIAHAAS